MLVLHHHPARKNVEIVDRQQLKGQAQLSHSDAFNFDFLLNHTGHTVMLQSQVCSENNSLFNFPFFRCCSLVTWLLCLLLVLWSTFLLLFLFFLLLFLLLRIGAWWLWLGTRGLWTGGRCRGLNVLFFGSWRYHRLLLIIYICNVLYRTANDIRISYPWQKEL